MRHPCLSGRDTPATSRFWWTAAAVPIPNMDHLQLGKALRMMAFMGEEKCGTSALWEWVEWLDTADWSDESLSPNV